MLRRHNAPQQLRLRASSRRRVASVAREALELVGRPVERLFHGLAAEVAHRHLGHQRLNVDLLADLVRRRRAGERQDLVIVDIRIVVERALGRALLGPGLEGRELLERRQVVAVARLDHLLGRRRLRKMDDQALGRRLVLAEIPDAPEVGHERRIAALRSGGRSRGSTAARRPWARRAWPPPRRWAGS